VSDLGTAKRLSDMRQERRQNIIGLDEDEVNYLYIFDAIGIYKSLSNALITQLT